ncbi:MAG: response regulator [Candidatus Omnitrophica bacterium]|nr:response regulator [Candidatus Omnitrophota bacterium]
MESKKNRILIIEDNIAVQNLYREILKRYAYEVEILPDTSCAIDLLKKNHFDLIILDLHLPEEGGMSFLERLRKLEIEVPPVIVCTGLASIEIAVDAIKKGASDFITKPFNLESLISAIERNIRINELVKRISEIDVVRSILELNKIIISITDIEELCTGIIDLVYNLVKPDVALLYFKDDDTGRFFLRRTKGSSNEVSFPIVLSLSDAQNPYKKNGSNFSRIDNGSFEVLLIGKKDAIGILRFYSKDRSFDDRELNFLSVFGTQIGIALENAKLLQQLQDSYISSIRSLVNSLEAKDAYTKNHSEQVAYYAVAIGRALGLDGDTLESLRNAAYLHDLGKLGIKDEIISKKTSLSREEFEIIKKHPLITREILSPLRIRKEEMDACLYHHEKFDGKGYPEGIAGEKIPLLARILAVADSLSAMISERPYRKKMEIEDALQELKRNSGQQFDETVVKALIDVIRNSKEKQ